MLGVWTADPHVMLPWAICVGALIACQAEARPPSDTAAVRCELAATDSARAVCVAIEAASKRAGRAQRLHEFRRDSGGFSILTPPEMSRGTDGDLTVRLSRDFVVLGFGPDSA